MDVERRVAEILGAWQRARERGAAPDPEDVIRRNPDLADALRPSFDLVRALDEMRPPAELERGPIVQDLGPYRVLEELGRGGMGTVYLAEVVGEAPGLAAGQQVALKVLHPELLAKPGFLERFLREAEAGRQVRVSFLLWKATADGQHLRVARELLSYLVEHAPAEFRESMVRDVPLRQEIAEA